MVRYTVETLAAEFRHTHDLILMVVDDLSGDQMAWSPDSSNPSIAGHVWRLAERSRQLLTAITGLPAQPGPAASGSAPDSASATTDHPATGKEAVLSYTRDAFAALEQMLASLSDEQLSALHQPALAEALVAGATVGDALMAHLSHANRQIGEIECLRTLLRTRFPGPNA